MKVNNIFKIGVVMAAVALPLTSCNDFLTIYPTDKTTGEDFWKKKEDVKEMVAGAYKKMTEGNIQQKAIMWGSYRSDEMEAWKDLNEKNLENIDAANIMPSNGYCDWSAFYDVINRCNIVINHLDQVAATDPQFYPGDRDEAEAQMRSLRSLCYFYLVRAFRDVPYTTHSYEVDQEVENVPQYAPDSVLQCCIEDLEYAQNKVLNSGAYPSTRDNYAYFTKNSVWALMADIYLWRASMKHGTDPEGAKQDYAKCVEYCDKVINAMDAKYREDMAKVSALIRIDEKEKYHLLDGSMAHEMIFGSQRNSRESILEWQYQTQDGFGNTELATWYSRRDATHAEPKVYASMECFFTTGNSSTKSVYLNAHDYRFWNNVFDVNNSLEPQLCIRKMVGLSDWYNSSVRRSTNGQKKADASTYAYSLYGMDWIVYRLTDIMLMKAEALVWIDDAGSRIREAYQLVKEVNDRSWIPLRARQRNSNEADADKTLVDSLTWSTTFASQAGMEQLVMAERLRELCFEGKRWFDLVRFSYRHMTNVDITKKMVEYPDPENFPALSEDMKTLMVRKVAAGGESVKAKMKAEAHLYWPVPLSDTKVNSLLVQNPVWKEDKSMEKN